MLGPLPATAAAAVLHSDSRARPSMAGVPLKGNMSSGEEVDRGVRSSSGQQQHAGMESGGGGHRRRARRPNMYIGGWAGPSAGQGGWSQPTTQPNPRFQDLALRDEYRGGTGPSSARGAPRSRGPWQIAVVDSVAWQQAAGKHGRWVWPLALDYPCDDPTGGEALAVKTARSGEKGRPCGGRQGP